MSLSEQAVLVMKRYYGDWQRGIDHTQKVLGYAMQICDGENIGEGFLRDVIALAAIFHDIGIPAALKKYGTSAHTYQEQEGPPIAADLMLELGVRPDVLSRVCYIVGHHHTRQSIDGLDFQVLWEADALVNIPARGLNPDPEQREAQVSENFRTETGKRLMRRILFGQGAF